MACTVDGKEGIVEENDLYITSFAEETNDMTEEDFNKILDRIEAIYSPIIKARSKTLIIERKWEDGTVNAYARQSGGKWYISMFGGLARHQTITKDAFTLVACHEIGHHLGGAPRIGRRWASNEGQSDYFASLKCMRKFMENDKNEKIALKLKAPAYVKESCSLKHQHSNDISMCIRNSMAGLSLGNLFSALSRSSKKIKFATPDKREVKKTNDRHPPSQCRLDTYFQGALCEIDHYVDVSAKDFKVGTCSREGDLNEENFFQLQSSIAGYRPLCWFQPTKPRNFLYEFVCKLLPKLTWCNNK